MQQRGFFRRFLDNYSPLKLFFGQNEDSRLSFEQRVTDPLVNTTLLKKYFPEFLKHIEKIFVEDKNYILLESDIDSYLQA